MGVEVAVVAAAVAVVLWPLARLLARDAPRALRVLALPGCVVLAGSVAWGAAEYGGARALERALAVLGRPLEVAEEGYVTSTTCRGCHPREYATWHASYHRTMTQLATPDAVVAPFEDVELSIDDATYRLSRRGDTFWVDLPDTGSPETGSANGGRMQRPVLMTTGSHHFQLYWLPWGGGRRMQLFQFAYQLREQRWFPVDALVLAPPGLHQVTPEGGQWNQVCNVCHATRSRPRLLGPDRVDTRAAEFGISCEACHGPAEEHVRANRDPTRRYRLHFGEDGDESVTNPAKLDHRRGSEVCGQCHSVQTFRDVAHQSQWARDGHAFRPGDDLGADRVFLKQDDEREADFIDRFWPDGAVRVNGREYTAFLRSPCFVRGNISCTSCHAMHRASDDPRPLSEWADDQLLPDGSGSASCLGCHPQFADAEALVAHTHHEAESSGSDCTNCHMPNTAYGLHKATRNHQITNPDAAVSKGAGRPNACNLCHLDQTLAWSAQHLEDWYGVPQPELSADEREVSAGVRWILSGDAGQRAIAAWHMGWQPAQEASGTDWLPPYLAHLFVDPYAAVRSVAHRALRDVPGYDDVAYDFVAPRSERDAALRRVLQRWGERGGPRTVGDELLIDARGRLQREKIRRLISKRDNRPMYLAE